MRRLRTRIAGAATALSLALSLAIGGSAAAETTAPPPMPTGGVYIGGSPTAGHTALVRTYGWPDGTTFSYTWLQDGQPISGATAASYYVPGSLVYSHKIGVKVSASNPNYSGSVSLWGAALRVQPYSPIAGDTWGVDLSAGPWDHDLVQTYLDSHTTARVLQGKIATRPRATWFGGWESKEMAAQHVRDYIRTVQNGDPRTLVHLTLHTIWMIDGLNEDARDRPLTAQQQADYKAWMQAIATAIGTSRVLIIMEPDLAELPKAMSGEKNTADPVVRANLVGWATWVLAKNPNAAIYLDSGDSDWQSASTMVPWLKRAGMQYARGFALGATHYDTAQHEIAYGTQMVQALAAAGLPGKHYVIDTADNGKGFTWAQYAGRYGAGTFNNAQPCASVTATNPCVALGVPPGWQVADAKLSLTTGQKADAMKYLDGFVWFSRPWLDWQSSPYNVTNAQRMAAASPYA